VTPAWLAGTNDLLAAAENGHGVLRLVLGAAVLLAFAGWALLLVLLLLAFTAELLMRNKVRAGPRKNNGNLGARSPLSPPAELLTLLAELRRQDPHFDEQLLLEAAQAAVLLAFTATSTGDDAGIRRLVTEEFWLSTFGLSLKAMVRDRRRDNALSVAKGAAAQSANHWRPALEYQASVPELVKVELGADHRVGVRISFRGLFAIIRPGASEFTEAASSTSVLKAFRSLGQSIAANTAATKALEVSWLANEGGYDLTFARPAGSRTAPAAALSDRTCATCGATYRSEMAIACDHCRSERPLPWGRWRLIRADAVTTSI
jgi:hypothetical protein